MADPKVMTEAEVKALVSEEVKRAHSPAEVEKIAGDIVQKYLAGVGAAAQVARVVIGDPDAPKKRSGWDRLAGTAAAALNAAVFGHKDESVNLDALRASRAEYGKRTGQSTTTTAGGYLIPTEEILEPIDLIGATESLLGKCNNHPMATGALTIVTADGDITVYWIPETTNSSDMATQAKGQKQEGQFTFGRISLAKRWVVARVAISKQSDLYTGGGLKSFLQTRIPARLRKACEIAILRGGGVAASDPITGLDSLVTTNVIAWDPTDPFKSILDLISAPELELPGVAETSLLVSNVRARNALLNVKDLQGRYVLSGPLDKAAVQYLYGVEMIKTPNVLATYPAAAGTDSRLYGGDFANHAHIGFDGMTFAVDPYTGLANNLVYLQYEMAFAFAVSSEKAFAYTDIPR